MKPDYYTDRLLEICSIYRENKPLVFEMLKKFSSPVTILSEVYLKLVKGKEITPLEELPESEKREIWGLSAGQEDRLKWSRAFYTLKII